MQQLSKRADAQKESPTTASQNLRVADSRDGGGFDLSNYDQQGATMTGQSVSAATPTLTAAEQETVGTELPNSTPEIGGTLMLLALTDIEYLDYVPLVGIAPIVAGGILDIYDRGTTYAELDDGVGMGLTTAQGAVSLIGEVVDNVSTTLSIVTGVAGFLSTGWGPISAVVAPVGVPAAAAAKNVGAACDVTVACLETIEASISLTQMCWDAYQASRFAADGQQEVAEMYGHMAMDDAIDTIESAISAGLSFTSLAGVGFPAYILKGVMKGAAGVAFTDSMTTDLHHEYIGENYTTESRTPRGLDAWSLAADDATEWWASGGPEEATQQQIDSETEDERQQRDEQQQSMQDAINAAVQERWEAFLEDFDTSAWLGSLDGASSASFARSNTPPDGLAIDLDAAEAQLVAPINALLNALKPAAEQTVAALAEALVTHRGELARIQEGHALLDTMAGEVQSMAAQRALLHGALTDVASHLGGIEGCEGVRDQVVSALSAQIGVLDEQIERLETRVAEERAILDGAFGAGGVVEASMQAALDRTVLQLQTIEQMIADFEGLQIDIPGTLAWLNEVADALN